MLASLHASVGHQVVGVDINDRIVKSIQSSEAPFYEPGLQDLLNSAGERLSATTEIEKAVMDSEVSIVIVPTPSDAGGGFTNQFVLEAVSQIGAAIKGSPDRHTVLIASTVMPGSCTGEIQEALERASGKQVGTEVGLAYNPQFIALGSIVSNMRRPDLVLIGESDLDSGQVAVDLALALAENNPAVSRIGLSSAELAKLAINTYVTTKISFANMLGEFCDALGDANVDDVTLAVGSDSRIGRKYLQGALGYGGPCFPRDNIALASAAKKLNVDASIAIATDGINQRQVQRILNLVSRTTTPRGSIAVLGLAYKPGTPVCDRSQSIEIANFLLEGGHPVSVYDELVTANDATNLSSAVRVHNEPNDEIYSSDVAIFTHPIHSFKRLDLANFSCSTVLDLWGSADESDFPTKVTVVRPGRAKNESLVSD